MSVEPVFDKRKLLALLGRWVFLGILVCMFSLNGVLRFIANHWPGTRTNAVLTIIASVPDSFYRSLPGGQFLLFELLMRWVVILLAVHVLFLLIASIRHMSLVIFVSGMSGLLIGLFALTWLSILIIVVLFLFGVLGWIWYLLRLVFEAIVAFFLWSPVFYTLLTLIGIAVLAVVVCVARDISLGEVWESFKAWLRNLSAKPLVMLLAMLAVGALVWFVGIPLWEHYISPILLLIRDWLTEYVAPIVSWIASLLVTVVLAVVVVSLVLVVVAVLGWQFADQFGSARRCGNNTHKSFEAGFAIGAVIGLVLLVCASNPTFRSLVNISWAETSPILSSMDLSAAVYYFMPARVEALLYSAFARASLPVFDVAGLILTLLLSTSSLVTSMLSRVTIEPLRALLAPNRLPPLGKVLFGVVIACGAVLADSVASEDA